MKSNSHIQLITKTPTTAQTNFAVKLQGTLDIVDTLLLAQRQSQWKAFFPSGGAEGSSGTTTTGGTDTGGIFGGDQ